MLAVGALAGCTEDDSDRREDGNSEEDGQDLVAIEVDGHTFRVEVADTPDEREQGLMGRTELAGDEGMLFVFPSDQRVSFWMKDTVLELSIAYILSDGRIDEIHPLEPESLEPVQSRRAIRYALEVKRGAFEERGIEPGDRVEIPDGIRALE